MTLPPDLNAPSVLELTTLGPEELAARMNGQRGTLAQRLGIEYSFVSPELVRARLPVEGNLQPLGRLHGGASLALAEELASVGSWLNVDAARQAPVGVDLSGTHVRGVTDGWVSGEATLAHRGRSVLVWIVEIRDERQRVTSLARCTCHVVNLGR